jgi:hypothetical protein
MGTVRNAYRIFVGNPEGTKLLRRPRRRWEDNITLFLKSLCLTKHHAVKTYWGVEV